MTKLLAVLPFALTMNLGPQIVSAIVIITGKNPIKKSLVYLLSMLIVATTVTFAAFIFFRYVTTGSAHAGESTANVVLDYVFVGLLALVGLRIFLKRKEFTKKPKWMTSLQDTDAKGVFKVGLMLFSFMPTDLVAMLTVAHYLASRKMPFYYAAPFVVLSLMIGSLPLLFYLLFKKQAQAVMPRVQKWMDTHAWLINEIVLVFFICMILFT